MKPTISDMAVRVADIADTFDAIGGMIAQGAYVNGVMAGIKLASEHHDAAAEVLASFFDLPHTERETAAFYTQYDYIAEGKEPS